MRLVSEHRVCAWLVNTGFALDKLTHFELDKLTEGLCLVTCHILTEGLCFKHIVRAWLTNTGFALVK